MSFLQSLFGKQASSATTRPATILDSVTYLAGLASNPVAIDPALDKVRNITSGLGPGQKPSTDAIQELLDVYLEIEKYLITKEPIRAFTKKALRERLDPGMQQQITDYETNHK